MITMKDLMHWLRQRDDLNQCVQAAKEVYRNLTTSDQVLREMKRNEKSIALLIGRQLMLEFKARDMKHEMEELLEQAKIDRAAGAPNSTIQ